MGPIRKKEIRIIGSKEKREPISYFQRCLKFSIYSVLQHFADQFYLTSIVLRLCGI
jgi:hypothetical protein